MPVYPLETSKNHIFYPSNQNPLNKKNMKMDNRNRLAIAVAALLIPLLALLLYESQKPSKTQAAKEVSTNGLSALVISQKKSLRTNQPPFSIPKNPSIVTNSIVAILPSGTNTINTNYDGQISASALKQIGALEAEKAKRTPVQQKIDSHLLYADKMQRGEPIAEGVPTQRINLDKDNQGRILVDIKANVTDGLFQYIETIGGNVVNDFPQYQAIRASIPLANIEELAARSEVKFVEPAVRAMNNTVDSQGDYTHQANTARTTFGINGAGIKVGVLSTSVDYLTNSQIAGKVTVLPGQSGEPNTGEGTAMLEIVNDLAPGAQLYFATGNSSEASFANNIQQLYAAGCNIIVDDILYLDESPFQDGIVAQAVNSVTANGVLYFSSAGNSGNMDSGTSGTWEGDFVNGGTAGTPVNGKGGFIHSFGSANYDTITETSSENLDTVLFWADPWDASTNDYDLFVLDSTGTTVVDSSTTTQNGTQDPMEAVLPTNAGERIVVVLASGTGRFLHLDTERGELAIGTQGSTRGHDCATNAFDVAATPAAAPQELGSPSGPWPNAFDSTNQVEFFSSDGPRRVFFQYDGTPITPGNFSSTGGTVRQKPDITAADGVTTDLPYGGGLNPFYGTSAAAPHAGAIAALLKSYNTNLTASQIRMVLTNTALDIMSPGVNRDSGAGIVMALAALQASPLPNLARFTDNLNNLRPHTGDVVTASITITNPPCPSGGTSAGAFHVGFYFSSSSSFSGISPFYEAPISGCPASGTTSLNQNITISAGTTPGVYYLGYKIDDENEVTECDESDNGIFYWTITVLPPPQPNLTRGTDNLNNSNPQPGTTITASVTVTNEPCTGGSTNAGVFHIGFYGLSTSTSFAGLTPFYELQVNGCAANGTISTNLNIIINAETAPGTYYLGYKIDDKNEIAECNEGDNGIYYWPVTVTLSDITPPTIAITSPTSASAYNTFSSSINLGGTASDNVGVTQVTWSNDGGGSGTASGTTTWSVTGVPLKGGTNVITVTAYDAAGNTGNAALTVTYNLPALGIVYQNTKIVLAWPTNAAGFFLQNATNLPASNWTTNSSSPYIVNGQYSVTNTISGATKFYRLIKS